METSARMKTSKKGRSGRETWGEVLLVSRVWEVRDVQGGTWPRRCRISYRKSWWERIGWKRLDDGNNAPRVGMVVVQ